MRQAIHDLGVRAFQADALFASAVQRCDEPDSGQVRQATAAKRTATRVASGDGPRPRPVEEVTTTSTRMSGDGPAAGFADNTPVMVRHPRTRELERGDRAEWAWLPGMITEQCASDEWRVVIEDMTVAVRPVRTRTLSAHRAAAAVRHAVVALAWKEA